MCVTNTRLPSDRRSPPSPALTRDPIPKARMHSGGQLSKLFLCQVTAFIFCPCGGLPCMETQKTKEPAGVSSAGPWHEAVKLKVLAAVASGGSSLHSVMALGRKENYWVVEDALGAVERQSLLGAVCCQGPQGVDITLYRVVQLSELSHFTEWYSFESCKMCEDVLGAVDQWSVLGAFRVVDYASIHRCLELCTIDLGPRFVCRFGWFLLFYIKQTSCLGSYCFSSFWSERWCIFLFY